MKKIAFTIVLLCSLLFTSCSKWKWAKSEGIVDDIFPFVTSAVDNAGNLIIAANYKDGTTYEGSVITNSGKEDVLIAKHATDGSNIMLTHFGSDGYEQNTGIASNAKGNIVVCGNYSSSILNFGNSHVLTNHGGRDFYIAKFNSTGNIIWARGAGNASDDGAAAAFTTFDNSGNVYAAGNFYGSTIDFGNSVMINSGGSVNNNFIVKYNSNGDALWGNGILCNTNQDLVQSITCDNYGNIYVTGGFNNLITFQSSTSYTMSAISSGSNIFLAKYLTDGTLLWAQCLGAGISKAIKCDGNGNLYMTGVFYGVNNEFGGHRLQMNSSDAGGRMGGDFFVAKFNVGGIDKTSWAWANTAGGSFIDMGTAITADNEVVWVSGWFGSPHIGDFGEAGKNLDNATTSITNATNAFRHFDSFLAEYDKNGKFVDVFQLGNDDNDQISGVNIKGPLGSEMYVAGTYNSTNLKFEGTTINKGPSINNCFIAKRTWKNQ